MLEVIAISIIGAIVALLMVFGLFALILAALVGGNRSGYNRP